MTRERRRRVRGEHGVVLPMTAAMLVVLFAFTALAIDVGHVYGVRRQAQTAADTGALGGGVSLVFAPSNLSLVDAVRNVKWFTYQDLNERPPTLAAWDAAWASCTDPLKPAMYTSTAAATAAGDPWNLAGAATSCISFTSNYQRMRVKLPDLQVNNFFAGAAGYKSFKTTAAGEVEVGFNYPGGVLPFGIPANSALNTELCLGTGNALPNYLNFCEGGAQGNYGALDPSFYGSTELGTLNTPYCSNTSAGGNTTENRIAMATAIGIDHPLGALPNDTTGVPADGSFYINDRDRCTAASPSSPSFLTRPNEIATETGVSKVAQGVRQGLYEGVAAAVGLPAQRGRLTRSTNTVSVHSGWSPLDNTPLWTFLTPGLNVGSSLTTQVPSACDPNQAWTGDRMLDCINAYKAGGYATVLFGRDSDSDPVNGIYDIMRNPRFGYVPILWTNFPSGQSQSVQIRRFTAIYIQTLSWGCNGTKCAATFDPGQPLVNDAGTAIGAISGNGTSVDAVTVLGIPPGALPLEARDVAPGGRNEIGITLVR